MFATLLLIPSNVALYKLLEPTDKIETTFVCDLLALAIPSNFQLVIILGRFVYPVHWIELSPEIYKLVVSTCYGGMHAVAIIFGLATFILSLVILNSRLGKFTAWLGFADVIVDIVGSYP